METNFFQGPRPCAIPKGDLDMKTSFAGPRRVTALAGLFALTLTASGAAMADSYNIIFKTTRDPTTILSCATGGFTFTKTGAGSFSPDSASAILSGCALPTFPTPANGSYTQGVAPNSPLEVVVADVVTTEPQGPNVVGLTGTLQMTTSAAGDCAGAGTDTIPKTYTINFSQSGTSGGTFNVTCTGDGSYTSATYPYYVYNTASSVPEPETLLLVLLGLGAMGWVVRKSRH
jgi:hypothetical protein